MENLFDDKEYYALIKDILNDDNFKSNEAFQGALKELSSNDNENK